MKRLLICLLLFGVVGCGPKEESVKSPAASKQGAESAAAQNETPEPSATKTDSPLLVDAMRGKRIYLQLEDKNLPTGLKEYQCWLEVGEGDQLTTGAGARSQTISFTAKDVSLFMVAPNDGVVNELRFTKTDLSLGDPLQIIRHASGVDLQTVLASTDDSTVKYPAPGVILKIEAAQPVDGQEPPDDE